MRGGDVDRAQPAQQEECLFFHAPDLDDKVFRFLIREAAGLRFGES